MTDEAPAFEARDSIERRLLVHLLTHRGHLVRFEADPGATEFGILRAFSGQGAPAVRVALRALENARLVQRRTQYVIGFSEPKLVYALTDTGQRRARQLTRESTDRADASALEAAPSPPGPVGEDTGA